MRTRLAPLVPALLLAAMAPRPVWGQETPAEAAIGQALELAAGGELAAAIELLQPVVEDPAAPPQARAVLGALLVETGRAEAAYRTLQPLTEAEPPDPAVLYNAGRAAVVLGELQEAERWLRRSLELEPASPALRELGLVLARGERCDEAYPYLKPWVEARPDDLEARRIAALCAVQLRRPNEAKSFLADLPAGQPEIKLLAARIKSLEADPWGAIELLEPLLEEAPPAMQGSVRRVLADAYVTTAQASKAVTVLEGRVGEDPSAALQLALAQYQGGDLDAALATLGPFAERALAEARPDGGASSTAARLVAEHGRLLVVAGRHEEAVPYLESATRLDPSDKQSWHQLGQALAVVGRVDEAREALARFEEIVQNEVPAAVHDVQLEKDLQDPTGRQLREAMTLAAAERYDEALELIRAEARLAPQDPRPPLLESRVLLLAGRTAEALEVAEALAAALPSHADAVYQRGAVRVATGDIEGAEADFRGALELAPEHTAAMSDLAVLLADRGDVEEARELLRRVLSLRPEDAAAAAALAELGD